MLAVLLVEVGQVIPLRVLSERVWGADTPPRAGNTLRAFASRLREALPEVEIERTGDGYRLAAPEDSIDLHRFRALAAENPAEALELWRGTPLSEMDSPWADETRTALLAERLGAALDDNDSQLRTAGHGGLLPNLLASDTEDHERQIGRALLGLYGDRPEPSGPVPRELPDAPTGFVGRGGELAALERRFAIQREEGAVTLAIHGQRGVGKSWLALRWAHDNLDRFPDGQRYVDLSAPVEPARAEGRMLLVLDNARDYEQLEPLLPNDPACTVIITSREGITTRGAQPLKVEPLGERHARDLLKDHLGVQRMQAEPAAVNELLSYCDGLPLSLGVITARARANPEIPLAALATELREYAAQLAWLDADDAELNLRVVLTFNQSPAAPGEPGRLRSLG
nr:NB-ARC domain-containing protein [Allokutzneria sp. A3M-2-11 16]